MDIKFHVPDTATLNSVAEILGFFSNGQILQSGMVNPVGNYQLALNNGDGSLYLSGVRQSGIYGGLRHNADPVVLSSLISQIPQNANVTIWMLYPIGWSSDGVTPAPDYVANIGVIA